MDRTTGSRGFDFDREYGATYQDRIRRIVPGYDDLATMMLGELTGPVPFAGRILVVGAGAGEEIAVMGALRPRWRFTGVDTSAQMLALARVRLLGLSLMERVTLHHGVTATLPREPLHDAATLALVLHFVPDQGEKLALLQAIAERLRPGAPLTLIDAHGDPDSADFRAGFDAWMRYLTLRGMTAEEHERYRAQLTASCVFVPESRLRELLAEAGFGPPRMFYRGYVFGGWITTRR
ncbi:MAG: class I SAM-dependent methyltransferase [Gemmatimonadales bacterium]